MNTDRQFDIILFDLEGTLVDFQWQLTAAVNEIIQLLAASGIHPDHYGNQPSYADLFNRTRDLTTDWKTTDTIFLFERLSAIYDKYDADALSRWQPYEETPFVLADLSKTGYQMGVVSNCGRYAVGEVLSRHNLMDHFDLVLSRNDVHYLKPHPESLNLARKKMHANPERMLFVGDSLNDILAAETAGMPSCFLSGGESLITGERARTATFHISSLIRLLDLLA